MKYIKENLTINNCTLSGIYLDNDTLYIKSKSIGHLKFIDNSHIEISLDCHTITQKHPGVLITAKFVNINVTHIYKYNGSLHLVEDDNEHIYSLDNCIELFTNNLESSINLEKFDFSKIKNFAEIGVRYGGSYKEYHKLLTNNSNIYLFEYNPLYCKFIKTFIDNRTKLFEGNAAETLLEISDDIIFDFVFFDASHIYNIDRNILESLLKHINHNTTIVFDDYKIPDVKKLVDELISMDICNVNWK